MELCSLGVGTTVTKQLCVYLYVTYSRTITRTIPPWSCASTNLDLCSKNHQLVLQVVLFFISSGKCVQPDLAAEVASAVVK